MNWNELSNLVYLFAVTQCNVKWDFTEAELARGRAIIAKAACFYDRDRLGTDIDRIAQVRCQNSRFRLGWCLSLLYFVIVFAVDTVVLLLS